MAGLQSALAMITNFSFKAPDPKIWDKFMAWVTQVFASVYNYVTTPKAFITGYVFTLAGFELVTAFGAALSSVMAGLQSALAMITNFSFTAPDPKIWADFEAWVQAVFASFYALINSTGSYAGKPVPFGEDGLKLVTTFGSALSGLMGGLGAAMQVLTGLATYIAPAHSRITSFVTDVKTLMTEAIAQISSQITPEAAKLAGDMGTAIGNLANGLKAALDLFSTLAGTQPGVYTPGTAAGDFENRIGTLMAGIHGTLVAFRTYVQQKFPADWLPAAQTFATAVQQIFSVLSQALNLFRDLATTGMPSAQQLTAFVTAVLDIFRTFAVELSAQATPIQAAGTGINAGLINGLVAKLTGGTGTDTVEGKAKQVAKTLYDSIHNNITSYQTASGYGVAIDQGLIDGMVSKSSSVATTAFSLGAKIDSEIKRALGIASPSQAAMDIAGEVGAGAVLGLRGAMAQVGAAAAALGQAMLPGGGELAFANLPQQRMTVRHEVIVRSPDGSVDAAAMAALADRLGPYLRDGVRMRRY